MNANLSGILGIHATLYVGPAVAVPAPAPIVEALDSIEVHHNSEGRDGFQLTFRLGRGPYDIVDSPLLANPLLRPATRVVVQVWTGVVPEVLVDGYITHHRVAPSDEPGRSTLSVTGEDLRVLMDMREIAFPYPQMPPHLRAEAAISKYSAFIGSVPIAVPTRIPDVPLAIDRIPAQHTTDLRYVEELARDHDYVFYIEPTPAPMVNVAYWGPENRLSIPQPALSVGLGPQTNVESLNFDYDALKPTTVLGVMQEKRSRAPLPVVTVAPLRPPLAALPATLVQQPFVRSVFPRDSASLDPVQALARAQAVTDDSGDALSGEGELDAARYGGVLRARRLVGVRGAGWLLDGLWYVKRVTHRLSRGEYRQSFSLTREGVGSLTPVVRP